MFCLFDFFCVTAGLSGNVPGKPGYVTEHALCAVARTVFHREISRCLEHFRRIHFVDHQVMLCSADAIALRASEPSHRHAKGNVLAIVPLIELVFPRCVRRHFGKEYGAPLHARDCMTAVYRQVTQFSQECKGPIMKINCGPSSISLYVGSQHKAWAPNLQHLRGCYPELAVDRSGGVTTITSFGDRTNEMLLQRSFHAKPNQHSRCLFVRQPR